MAWSSGLLGGGGGRSSSCLLVWVGVVLRLLAQGLIESTAELKYDFSGFLSAAPGAMVEANARCHATRGALLALLDKCCGEEVTDSKCRL